MFPSVKWGSWSLSYRVIETMKVIVQPKHLAQFLKKELVLNNCCLSSSWVGSELECTADAVSCLPNFPSSTLSWFRPNSVKETSISQPPLWLWVQFNMFCPMRHKWKSFTLLIKVPLLPPFHFLLSTWYADMMAGAVAIILWPWENGQEIQRSPHRYPCTTELHQQLFYQNDFYMSKNRLLFV